MSALQMNGLLMPSDFPRELFEKIYTAAQPHDANPAHPQFIGAWSAVSHRYKALAHYDEVFTRSIETHGSGPAYEVRYEQERDLFGFASNAYSVFEAFHYAMFAIGSLINPNIFVLKTADDEKKVNIQNTRSKYSNAFPSDQILISFKEFFDDPARRKLATLRHVLTHRAVKPRAFELVIGASDAKPSAEITGVNISLDKNTTASRRAEVSRLLTMCLQGAETFVASKL
jgi:hypothetical protein